MKLSTGEALKTLIRKLGIKNPEQYDAVLEELKTEFEEEIEGDLKQRIDGLKTVEEFKKDKVVRKQMKAEFLNGLEDEGLGELVKALDNIDQAEYARKDGATNKVKHLIDATVKAKTKQLPPNQAEEEILRKKVLEMEEKITNGDYVPKAQIEALTGKINALNEGSFKDKILSKLSPKVVDHMNDADLLNLKINNFMKGKNLTFNHEDGKFYESRASDGTSVLATKHDKTVDLMGIDDLVNNILASDDKLVKKSDTLTAGEIVVNVPKVISNDGVSQSVHDKAQQHLKQIGKIA